MAMKTQKIVGMKVSNFQHLAKEKSIVVQPARLIPSIIKKEDEKAICSIFLSAVKLIKEFREDIFSDIKLKRNGSHYFFVEPSFFDIPDRPDGLILHVVSGEIRDAVILEVKIGKNDIDDSQVERYVELAKQLGIKKILTVSNQFVPDPSQSPVHIKLPKNIELFHFSWSYLLTLAHILLYKNDHNIADEDQVMIMREVVSYMRAPSSGIQGFRQMKQGWKEVVKLIGTDSVPKKDDPNVQNAILSWQQEEKDMALILSQKLGLLVRTSSKQELKTRLESDYKGLCSWKKLKAKFKISNIVSDISVTADL